MLQNCNIYKKKSKKKKRWKCERKYQKPNPDLFSWKIPKQVSIYIITLTGQLCVCVCVKVLQAVYSGLCVKIKEVWISIVYNWNSVDTTSGSIEKGSSISFSLHIYFWKKLICHENSIFFSNLMYAFGNMLSITKKVAHFIFRQFSKKFQLYFERFINATS